AETPGGTRGGGRHLRIRVGCELAKLDECLRVPGRGRRLQHDSAPGGGGVLEERDELKPLWEGRPERLNRRCRLEYSALQRRPDDRLQAFPLAPKEVGKGLAGLIPESQQVRIAPIRVAVYEA